MTFSEYVKLKYNGSWKACCKALKIKRSTYYKAMRKVPLGRVLSQRIERLTKGELTAEVLCFPKKKRPVAPAQESCGPVDN